ncbi:MAG: sulfatase [Pirellulales bacterium]
MHHPRSLLSLGPGALRILAVPLLLLLAASATAEEPRRLNILWISLEDISPDLGCYGDRYAVTPHIDRLAAQGTRFTRAFTHAGVCAPSRSGIILGMYPTSAGTHHMRSQGVPPTGVKCFPELLRAAGYFCTNDSKTDYNFAAPLTAWDENRAGAHWRQRPRPEQPFFAVINLTTTHESQIRLSPAAQQQRQAALSAAERHDPQQAVLPPYYPDTPVTRLDWARYHDNLTFTDKQVGKILQELEDDGLADHTVVFFWGDHGRGLPRAKRWIYDSGIHVPLIVRWPGKLTPGSMRDDLVALIDLAPTVLSIAGIRLAPWFQGQAFLGPLQAAQPRQYIYAARDRMDETYDMIRAVRDERYKYLRNYRPDLPYAQPIAYMDEMPTMREWRRLHALDQLVGPASLFFAPQKPVEELYDLAADPHEINNLAADPGHADTLRRLRAAHERWQRETGDLGLVPEAELQARVRPDGQWMRTEPVEWQEVDGQITLRCATPGASIAYHLTTTPAASDDAAPAAAPSRRKAGYPRGAARERNAGIAWQLYTQPLPRPRNATLRTRACRLGYRDSDERTYAFE